MLTDGKKPFFAEVRAVVVELLFHQLLTTTFRGLLLQLKVTTPQKKTAFSRNTIACRRLCRLVPRKRVFLQLLLPLLLLLLLLTRIEEKLFFEKNILFQK